MREDCDDKRQAIEEFAYKLQDGEYIRFNVSANQYSYLCNRVRTVKKEMLESDDLFTKKLNQKTKESETTCGE